MSESSKNLSYALVVAAFAAAAPAANATLLKLDVEGYFSDNHIINPFFASAFPNDLTLYGKSVSISMVLDAALAGPDILGGSVAGRAAYASGSCPGLGSNWIQTTSIVIDGIAFNSLLPGAGNAARCDYADVFDQSATGRTDDYISQDWEVSQDIAGNVTRDKTAAVTIGLHSLVPDFLHGTSLEQYFAFDSLDFFGAQIVQQQDYTTCNDDGGGCSKTRTVNVNETINLRSVSLTDPPGDPVSIPEPGTAWLLLGGVLVIAARYWQRSIGRGESGRV